MSAEKIDYLFYCAVNNITVCAHQHFFYSIPLAIQVNENKDAIKGKMIKKTLIEIRHARRDISTLAMDSVNFCTSSSTSVYFRMLLSNRGSFVQCCNGATSRSVSFNLWQRGSWQQACDSLCVKELWSKNSWIIECI